VGAHAIPHDVDMPDVSTRRVGTLDGLMDVADRTERMIPPFMLGDVVDRNVLASIGRDPNTPWPLQPVFHRLLAAAAVTIEEMTAGRDVGVSSAAARGMLGQLARRWNQTACQVLTHQIDVADAAAGHPGPIGSTVATAFFRRSSGGRSDEWARLFAAYPVLAHVLSVTFANWRDALAELLDRLFRDRDRLARACAGGTHLGRLVEYGGDAGDLHSGGRSVVVLGFDTGIRLVYKPRDLRAAAAFMDLVASLNRAGLDHPLHVRRIVPRDGYAWDEFVQRSACGTREEITRYYWRLGAYARLLQLLDGTDFGADNVVACGEHPVLVDLETLLSPRIDPTADVSALARDMTRRSWDSPWRSGLISARIPGDAGRRAADVGAAAPAAARIAPFGLCAFDEGSAIPHLRGEPARAADHFDVIVRGYVAMARSLRQLGDTLCAPAGPIDRMGDCPVRFIHRNTHIYSRLLDESLRPSCLRDAAERTRRLDRLRTAAHHTPPAPAVVQSEIDALRVLDIPLFTAAARQTSLMLGRDGHCHGFFTDTAWDRLRARMRTLADRSDDEEAELMRTTLFTLEPETCRTGTGPRPLAVHADAAPSHCRIDWLQYAVAVGDEILTWRCASNGEAAWLGLDYHPWSDTWRFGLLQSDLFSGSTGLAVLFDELFRWSRRPRFNNAARGILGPLRNDFTRVIGEVRNRASGAPAMRPFRCGAYYGIGAWFYALHRHALASGEDEMLTQALNDLEGLAPATLVGSSEDVLSGRAGLMLAILARDPALDDRRLRELAIALGQQLVDALASDQPDVPVCYPPDSRPLDAVPSGRSGIALALSGVPRVVAPALADRVGLIRKAHRWPLDDSATRATSGEALARLGAARHDAPSTDGALSFAERLLIAPATTARSSELLESAEIALTAFQLAGRHEHYELAESCAAALLERHRASGSWLPECVAADRHNLSAVLGVAAVAHLFLRLQHPQTIGSVRLLGMAIRPQV
jgi:type 2 lantibiotic biosynthesis protein LanM